MPRLRISARAVKMAWFGGIVTILLLVSWCVVAARIIQAPTPSPSTTTTHHNSELLLVHTISRHGIRTPADTFPTDIHINDTLYPFGWGSLTNEGRMQMFLIGKYLRSRYDNFLGPLYSEEATFAQSTGATRARMSCALLLAGLWPPAGTPLDWNPILNWQPIPIVTQELDEDTLLLVRKPCPRYEEARADVVAGDKAQAFLTKWAPVLKELSELSGQRIANFDDVLDIYSTLRSEDAAGLELTEWTKDFYPDKLEPLAIESFLINTYTDELIRLKGGVFFKKLVSDWRAVVTEGSGKRPARMSVFTGHDSTVANVARALGVWTPQVPDFAATLMVELRRNIDTRQYFIEVFLKNATNAEPSQLVVDGCTQQCPLDKVISLRSHLVPVNWTGECQPHDTGYTPPPLRGP